ncbi:MAG TPA: hypothetical protein VFL53_21390 [Pseudolabrys sp.]|nr:hypothetical protein [Pseudolabrys sp.]
MKAFFGAALLSTILVSEASAQLGVGPITMTNHVNGVPITVSATSWITVNEADSERAVDARIFIDLVDLQRKFAAVIDRSGISAADCAKRDADSRSPAVSLTSGSLLPVDDQLIMSVRGKVDLWECKARPAKSAIVWKKQKIGFLNIKLPERRTVKAAMKKTKDGTQPFRGNLPIQLVQKDRENVALKISDPEIKLEGQDVAVSLSNLDNAKLDINKKVYATIQSAINFVKLKAMLPKELQKSTVVSTRFRSQGGHAIAEINLAATNALATQ